MNKLNFIILILCFAIKCNVINGESHVLHVKLDTNSYVLNEEVVVHLEIE